MAKRHTRKRTAVPVPAPSNGAPKKPGSRSPKSMVIRIGASEVGPSITQLVHDVRGMLEPDTAVRLKERRNNKLRDYTTMAGPLGVTHLLLFSRSKDSGNVNLRVAVTPRGPTLSFRVEGYSLCKDVLKSQRRPRGGRQDLFNAAPLLVMNNFTTPEKADGGEQKERERRIPKHLESLTTTIFQSIFPPINPTTTPLKNIKRVLLLDRTTSSTPESDAAPYTLNLRHYAIETRTAKSVPKSLRRLDAAEKLKSQKRKRGSGIPDLGKLDDVADYLLDPHAADGFTSGSDSEPETDAEVEVLAPTAQNVPSRRNKNRSSKEDGTARDRRDPNASPNVQKKGIKLHELGPRLKLRMTKVEEGLCGGKVMWHEYIQKSAQEVREMERTHEKRRQEKEARKAEQKANVERKRAERKANGEEPEEEEEDEDMDEWDDEEDDELDNGDLEDDVEDEDHVMDDGGVEVG